MRDCLACVAGGAGQRAFAFVGALAVSLTLFTTVGVCDVPIHDKDSETFWRLRIGAVDPFVVLVARIWPYPVVAVGGAALVLLVTAPLLGLMGLAVRLIPLLPLYALMSATSTALGLAGAVLAVSRRSDVLVGNLLAYLVMISSAALVPVGSVGWLDEIGAFLPLRHGLRAVRAACAGTPFATEMLREAAVGAGWFMLAWAIFRIQGHRARRSGRDDFA